MTEQELIAGCKQEDRRAQKAMYERFAPLAFSICKRYLKTREDAEDVLVDALYKVLTNIHQYKGAGSFEGWVRRIIVNESLMFLRKKHNFNLTLELKDIDIPETSSIVDELAAQDILDLLDRLPTGYRTIFNLYVLEGFKHREIAEILDISINTSKSQLILARKRLQHLLSQSRYPGVG